MPYTISPKAAFNKEGNLKIRLQIAKTRQESLFSLLLFNIHRNFSGQEIKLNWSMANDYSFKVRFCFRLDDTNF